MKKLLLMFLLLLGMVSCGYGEKFIDDLNKSGGNYSVAKNSTINGYIVVKDNNSGKYYAVNYEKWKSQGSSNASAFFSNGGTDVVDIKSLEHTTRLETGTRLESYEVFNGYRDQICSSYDNWDSYDPTTGLYYKRVVSYRTEWRSIPYTYTVNETLYHGENGWIFEETDENSKDLEGIGADLEAKDLVEKSEVIAGEFGLSEERSMKIARLHNTYSKITSKRSLSDADRDIFSKEILGIEYSKAKDAFKKHIQGDSTEMNSLLEDAAEVNETSPEHLSEILLDFMM